MRRSHAAWTTLAVFAAGAILLADLAGGQNPQPDQATGDEAARAQATPDQTARTAPDEAPDEAAVARAKKTVRMLDDIYKTAVVLITDKYVHNEDDFPAGSAAVAWFSAISEKGWHEVRLIDATGSPYRATNVARDDFERNGVASLRGGEAYVDEVIEEEGKPYLRALTPVPVVMEKCTMCHANYLDEPEGAPIGAISYKIPIE